METRRKKYSKLLTSEKDSRQVPYNQERSCKARVWLNRAHPRNVKHTPLGDSVGRTKADTWWLTTVGIATGPAREFLNDTPRLRTPRAGSGLRRTSFERPTPIRRAAAKDLDERNTAEKRRRWDLEGRCW